MRKPVILVIFGCLGGLIQYVNNGFRNLYNRARGRNLSQVNENRRNDVPQQQNFNNENQNNNVNNVDSNYRNSKQGSNGIKYQNYPDPEQL